MWAILQNEPRSLKLAPAVKAQVLDIISNFDGFVDVQTIAGWLLFSGRQVGSLDEFMAESTLYNRIVKSDYATADGYLDGLIITCENFEKLLPKYQNMPNCLLVLDPPYICTAQGAYSQHGYFGMTKFLELMQFVRPPYVFFSSTRSELLDYMAYLGRYEPSVWERVGNFERMAVKAGVNMSVAYEDNILSKF